MVGNQSTRTILNLKLYVFWGKKSQPPEAIQRWLDMGADMHVKQNIIDFNYR